MNLDSKTYGFQINDFKIKKRFFIPFSQEKRKLSKIINQIILHIFTIVKICKINR